MKNCQLETERSCRNGSLIIQLSRELSYRKACSVLSVSHSERKKKIFFVSTRSLNQKRKMQHYTSADVHANFALNDLVQTVVRLLQDLDLSMEIITWLSFIVYKYAQTFYEWKINFVLKFKTEKKFTHIHDTQSVCNQCNQIFIGNIWKHKKKNHSNVPTQYIGDVLNFPCVNET